MTIIPVMRSAGWLLVEISMLNLVKIRILIDDDEEDATCACAGSNLIAGRPPFFLALQGLNLKAYTLHGFSV
jgi:hypothetical protein